MGRVAEQEAQSKCIENNINIKQSQSFRYSNINTMTFRKKGISYFSFSFIANPYELVAPFS